MDLAKHRGVTACSQNWDSIFKQWGLNQCDLTATVYGFPPVSILGSLRLNDMNLLLAFSSFKVPTIWWVGFPIPQIVGVGVTSLDLSAWLFDRKSWPPCRRNSRSWQMRAVMSLLLWKRLVTGITHEKPRTWINISRKPDIRTLNETWTMDTLFIPVHSCLRWVVLMDYSYKDLIMTSP